MKQKLSAGLSGASERLKGVVEAIDVGVPVDVAYDQWFEYTRYEVVDEAPNERIVWRSEDGKHTIDGAVTFHELAPRLTRLILVEEHHAFGLTGRAGDLARAHRKRARQELTDFQHHVMGTVLRGEDVERSGRSKAKRKRGKPAK